MEADPDMAWEDFFDTELSPEMAYWADTKMQGVGCQGLATTTTLSVAAAALSAYLMY